MCMYVSVQTHVHEASVDAHYSPNASRLKFHGDEERFHVPDHMHIVGYGGTGRDVMDSNYLATRGFI